MKISKSVGLLEVVKDENDDIGLVLTRDWDYNGFKGSLVRTETMKHYSLTLHLQTGGCLGDAVVVVEVFVMEVVVEDFVVVELSSSFHWISSIIGIIGSFVVVASVDFSV